MPSAWKTQDASIIDLFEEQVRRRPDATALRFLESDMSYEQLNNRSTAVRHHLEELGVQPGECVAVSFQRSFEMVVALLGILKAGAAYMPIHPEEPLGRAQYMLQQSGAKALLTHDAVLASLPRLECQVINMDCLDISSAVVSATNSSDRKCDAESIAYICYTSGSTGDPKGVIVPHRGVTRLVRPGNYASFGPDEVFLQLCTLTFDPAVFEIFGALLNGGRLVIFPPGRLSLDELAHCLEREKISTLWLTTGLFHRFVDSNLHSLGGLRQLLAGGDVLSPVHVNRVVTHFPQLRFFNGYGPTENTCFTTCFEVSAPVHGSVPIGHEISDTRVYVLDDDLVPVADGEWGNLYTAGAGLALGYLGQPSLTAQRFPNDPFVPGERMYDVGDVVRRRPDGALEFRGRLDDQVKVGGYRVELGEVVAALADHEAVKEVVVISRDDYFPGEKALVAYVVPSWTDDHLVADLRIYLFGRLPRHMIPSAFVIVDSLPLTRNGKVDRSALPLPPLTPRESDGSFQPPRTPTESLIASLWADALSLRQVSIHDDFFEIGGNSLVAADLLGRMREALSATVPATQLFFENPTVAGLAELVDSAQKSSTLMAARDLSEGEPK